MARKILNKTTGTSGPKFLGDDTDYINQLLTGTDQGGSDPVDINTQWTHRDSKMRISNPANTFYYTIAGSGLTANRILTLPLLTAGDTLLTEAFPATITNKIIPASTNTYQNIHQRPDAKRITGHWPAMDQITTNIQGSFTYTIGGGSITAVTNNTASGRFATLTTPSGTANSSVRLLSTPGGFYPIHNQRIKFKFAAHDSAALTNSRLYIGDTNTSGTDITTTSDDLLNGRAGVGIGWRSTDTTFQILHNDGSGSTVADNTAITLDTSPHTFEVVWSNSGATVKYSLDGGTLTTVSTEIPSSTTALNFLLSFQTTDTTARLLDLWYIITESDFV